MKKLLLFFFTLLVGFQAEAQYRFYAGLEGGPKWTFTENLTGMMHKTTEKQIGYSGAAVFGFVFPKERFAVETGFGGSSFDFKHNMEYGTYGHFPNDRWPEGFEVPELYVSKIGLQIPVRIRSRLYQSENEKWQIWLTGGAVFTVVEYGETKVKGNFIVNDSIRHHGILISKQIDEDRVSNEMDFPFYFDSNPMFMIETGLETHYKISNRFLISIKARHQSGLRSVFYSYVEDVNKSSRNGQYITRLNTSSNGSGVYLNLGLTYAFGKRNKSPE